MMPHIISWRDLRRMVPYTRQHVLRLEKRGEFPRRIQVGARRIGWLLSEVEDWVATRLASRDKTPQKPQDDETGASRPTA